MTPILRCAVNKNLDCEEREEESRLHPSVNCNNVLLRTVKYQHDLGVLHPLKSSVRHRRCLVDTS